MYNLGYLFLLFFPLLILNLAFATSHISEKIILRRRLWWVIGSLLWLAWRPLSSGHSHSPTSHQQRSKTCAGWFALPHNPVLLVFVNMFYWHECSLKSPQNLKCEDDDFGAESLKSQTCFFFCRLCMYILFSSLHVNGIWVMDICWQELQW